MMKIKKGMNAEEFFMRLPASNEVLEDNPPYYMQEYTEKELLAFAEAYAEYKLNLK